MTNLQVEQTQEETLCPTCNTIAPPNMCDCVLALYESHMDNMRPYTQGTGERS